MWAKMQEAEHWSLRYSNCFRFWFFFPFEVKTDISHMKLIFSQIHFPSQFSSLILQIEVFISLGSSSVREWTSFSSLHKSTCLYLVQIPALCSAAASLLFISFTLFSSNQRQITLTHGFVLNLGGKSRLILLVRSYFTSSEDGASALRKEALNSLSLTCFCSSYFQINPRPLTQINQISACYILTLSGDKSTMLFKYLSPG